MGSNEAGGLDDTPSLTISGRDIRSLDIRSLRSLIAIVPQTPVLLQGTLRDNIAYGLVSTSALNTASKIETAAVAAGIHDFIMSLPQGYATQIGEGGIGLSGGQAQRIVVARAFLRNPRILILDEATSALDRKSAEVIRQSIIDLLKKKHGKLTVIVVTHAKAMMNFADHVAVMEQGSVVEQGSFQQLMVSRGRLWHMLNAGGVSHDDGL
jgi:ATP-binding cassette subfamily B (MDR/TAP) protein 1